MEEIITNSVEETQRFAEQFAKQVKPGDVVTLSGELGAGKTTFTQGFAKGLGITHRIISPTFVIIRTYKVKDQKSKIKNHNVKTFYHVDLYRIENKEGIYGLGLEEMLREGDVITLIEWPERMGSFLPEKRWDITIESLGENERKIRVEKFSI